MTKAALASIAAFLIVLFLLPESGGADNEQIRSKRHVNIDVDQVTGCEYLHSWDGGLTPRIDTDGVSHRGCKEVAQQNE